MNKRGALTWVGIVGVMAAVITPLALLENAKGGETTPMLCWGEVQIDAVNAPIGTLVVIYIGGDDQPSATFITTVAGQYGAVVVQGDDTKYGQPLSFYINGREAVVVGGDAVFGLENQTVNIAVSTAPVSKTWVFNAAGCVPRHLPDAFMGTVILDGLSNVPVEIQGVYRFQDNWEYPELGKWVFWGFGAPACTLHVLGGGHSFDYLVCSTGACSWEIPLD